MTVLVVEDQSNVAEPLQDQLEADGHSCLTACDLHEAEWTLESVDIDVLVLDLDIPECDPLDWLDGLVLATPLVATSTVAITGRPLDESELMRIRASGASLLQKPFPIQDLHAAVLLHLRREATEQTGNGRESGRDARSDAVTDDLGDA